MSFTAFQFGLLLCQLKCLVIQGNVLFRKIMFKVVSSFNLNKGKSRISIIILIVIYFLDSFFKNVLIQRLI